MQIRTVSAILVWVAAGLLILNGYFRSELIFYVSVAILIAAVLVYFIPRFKRQTASRKA